MTREYILSKMPRGDLKRHVGCVSIFDMKTGYMNIYTVARPYSMSRRDEALEWVFLGLDGKDRLLFQRIAIVISVERRNVRIIAPRAK